MNTLSLKDLANELDDLREKAGCFGTDGQSFDEDEEAKYNELIAIEDTLGDLHVYSKNIDDCLIEEGDFEDYIEDQMEEMHPDLSHLPEVIRSNIDWRAVSDDCESDYNEIEYQGVRYFIRAG
jgi:hypothetical protein